MKPLEESSLFANVALNLYPPSLRESIISDSMFRSDHDIPIDVTVSLGGEGVPFQRTLLFDSSRESILKGDASVTVKDKDKESWSLKLEKDSDNNYILRLSNDTQTILVNGLWLMTPDIDERFTIFNRECAKRFMPTKSRAYWQDKLLKDHLSDDEISDLLDDLNNTPSHITEKLNQELRSGITNLQTLVPQNLEYYERLVGVYNGSDDISGYAEAELKTHFEDLCLDGGHTGLEFSLLMASHSSIAQSLSEMQFDETEFIQVLEFLIKQGDFISQTGAIELGILLLGKYPDLEPLIEKLLLKIIEKTSGDSEQQWDLLNALIVLVDSELAVLQIFQETPPFYRRLASFTQASLITKCIIETRVHDDDFCNEIIQDRSMLFYCQSLIDLRLESRWLPDYQSSKQIKAELIGRIYISASNNESKLSRSSLKELLFGSGGLPLRMKIGVSFMLPGPLEGNAPSATPSQKMSKELDEHLLAVHSNLAGFTVIINAVQFWKLDERHLKQIINVLRDTKYRLYETKEQDEILKVLQGLAVVSAITRNTELAVELSNIARRYRGYLEEESLVPLLCIGFLAAASHEDFEEWLDYIGGWVSELVYLPFKGESVKNLRVWLTRLIILEPRLACKCGRAMAILESQT